jgi:hypothetical protein
MAIYVHSADVLVGDPPSGDALQPIAAEALRRHDPVLDMSDGCHVRALVDQATSDLSIQLMRVTENAPGLVNDLLEERDREPWRYDVEVWSEALSSDVWVVWAAATRD